MCGNISGYDSSFSSYGACVHRVKRRGTVVKSISKKLVIPYGTEVVPKLKSNNAYKEVPPIGGQDTVKKI